jgi:hypothetical protein
MWPLSAMKQAIAETPLPPIPEKNIFDGRSCIAPRYCNADDIKITSTHYII